MTTYTEKLLDAAENFQKAADAYAEAQRVREAAAVALEKANDNVAFAQSDFSKAQRALSNAAVGREE